MHCLMSQVKVIIQCVCSRLPFVSRPGGVGQQPHQGPVGARSQGRVPGSALLQILNCLYIRHLSLRSCSSSSNFFLWTLPFFRNEKEKSPLSSVMESVPALNEAKLFGQLAMPLKLMGRPSFLSPQRQSYLLLRIGNMTRYIRFLSQRCDCKG